MTNGLVVLDGDGVLWDYDRHFRVIASQVLGREINKVKDVHLLEHRYNITTDERTLVQEAFDSEWYNVPELPHAQALVDAIKSLNYDIILLTAIPEEAAILRRRRVQDLGWDFKDVIAVPLACAAESKARVIKELNPVAFLDDNPEYVSNCFCDVTVLLHLGYADLKNSGDHVTVIDDPMDFVAILNDYSSRAGMSM